MRIEGGLKQARDVFIVRCWMFSIYLHLPLFSQIIHHT
jgi:hypothetical protein